MRDEIKKKKTKTDSVNSFQLNTFFFISQSSFEQCNIVINTELQLWNSTH